MLSKLPERFLTPKILLRIYNYSDSWHRIKVESNGEIKDRYTSSQYWPNKKIKKKLDGLDDYFTKNYRKLIILAVY